MTTNPGRSRLMDEDLPGGPLSIQTARRMISRGGSSNGTDQMLFATLGIFIMDDIVMTRKSKEGESEIERVSGVIGGAGTFAMVGAALL